MAIGALERLAFGLDHRQAQNGHRLAAQRLPLVLDMESSSWASTPTRPKCRASYHYIWRSRYMAIDFFTKPNRRLQILYVFLIRAHERLRIAHFSVTADPMEGSLLPEYFSSWLLVNRRDPSHYAHSDKRGRRRIYNPTSCTPSCIAVASGRPRYSSCRNAPLRYSGREFQPAFP